MNYRLLKIMLALLIVALLPITAYAADKGAAPVAHWRFDEGGGPTAYDDISTNDGTLEPGDNTGDNDTAGEMWSTQGKIGGALECDGANDYVSVTDNDSLDFGTGDFTVEAWIKSSMSGANGQIVMKSYKCSSNTGSPGWALYLDTVNAPIGRFAFMVGDGSQGGTMTLGHSDTNNYNDGNWHHVVAVADRSGNAIFYVDGVTDGSFDISGESGSISNSYPFLVGINYNAGSYGSIPFNGLIDDVRIYDYARTAAQVLVDYNAGAATHLAAGTDPYEGNPPVAYWKIDENTGDDVYDRSGNGNDGTLGGGTADYKPSWAAGKYGSALSFDGTNDYVDCGNGTSLNFGTGAFAMEAWIYYKGKTSNYPSVLYHQSATGRKTLKLDHNTAIPYMYTTVNDGGGNDAVVYGSTYGVYINENVWTHTAFTYDGAGTVKLYQDGRFVGSSTNASIGNTDTGSNLLLGITDVGGNAFNGLIDEVKIYDYARTAAQIAYDYSKGAPVAHYKFDEGTGNIAHNEYSTAGSGAAPVGWWRMDESSWNGTADEVIDSSGNGRHGTRGGSATTSSSSKIGPYCGTFANATSDRVATSQFAITSSTSTITFSCWVNCTLLSTDFQSIIGDAEQSNSTAFIWCYRGQNSNTLTYQDCYGTGYEALNSSGYFTGYDNQWVYVTVVADYANKYVDFYRNGVFVNRANMNSGALFPSQNRVYYIGAYSTTNHYMNGKMDDFRIYNYTRTAEQIYNDYKNTHGTLVNDTKFVDGKIGKALEFDGAGDYVNCGSDSIFALQSAFSIELWAKPNVKISEITSDKALIERSETNGVQIYLRASDDKIAFGQWGTSPYITASFPDDTNWHYIVATYDGSDGAFLYIEGVEVGSDTGVSTFNSGVADENLLIVSDVTNRYFSGQIDDVRIYNYTRTAAQILEDYTAGAARLGAQAAGEKDPWSGALPVEHWRFDENTGVLARDSSGNREDGTLGGGTAANMPTWTQGKLGPCLSFDGDDDYVDIGSLSTDPSTAVTLSAWIKPDTVSGTHEIIDSNGGWCSMYQIGTAIQMQTGSTPTTSTKGSAITSGNWHFVACTYDGSYIRNYIDGIEVGNTVASDGAIQGNTWKISRSGNTFSGLIDDVKIYNYARTQAQIAWDYNRGKPVGHWRFNEKASGQAVDITSNAIKDDSDHDNDGTASNTTWANYATGKFGSCLSFDGDDYVDCGQAASLKDLSTITVAAWLKPTSTPTYGNAVSRASYANGGWLLRVSQDSNGRFTPHVYTTQWYTASGSVIPLDEWTHLVLTYDGETLKGYMNGKEDCSNATPTGNLASLAVDTQIGRHTSEAGNGFIGLIDDVRIYNYVRTADQILQDCNAGAAARLGD